MSGYIEASFRARAGQFQLDVNFSIGRETGVVFGPSGSGKSLLLRCLSGLHNITSGFIKLDGHVMSEPANGVNLPPHRRGVCLMPQNLSLFPHLTVLENVTFGCEAPKSRRTLEDARHWLERMRIENFEKRYPSQLSGGQRQRVALARALAVRPKALLLDEPFSALDGPLKRNLRRELRNLQQETGIPFIYVTHQVEDICALGDSVHFMHEGTMTESICVEDLMHGKGRLRFWKMMGWGNLMEGVVTLNPHGRKVFRWNGKEITVREYDGTGEGLAFIRPDMIRLLDPRLPVDEEIYHNVFTGKVEDILLEGGVFRIHVSTDSGIWQIEQKDPVFCSQALRTGEDISFAFHPDSVELILYDTQKKEAEASESKSFAPHR